MRVDEVTIPFTAQATGAVVALIDVRDSDMITVAVNESAKGGTVTNHGYDLVPFDGTSEYPDGDVVGTPDLLANPLKAVLSRVGTAGAAKTTLLTTSNAVWGLSRQFRVKLWVTGGGTLTGTVVIWKHTV